MGGMISVGIRRRPQALETITAWTNPLPGIVKSKAFIEGDFTEFDEYIAFYREDRNQQGYGPSRHVPSEYGYVLFDFVEKRMAAASHYTTLDRIGRNEIESWRKDRRDDVEALIGLITHKIEVDGDVGVGPLTLDMLPVVEKSSGKMFSAALFTNYRFRFPGWKVVASGGSTDAFHGVYAQLNDLLELRDDDHEAWKRHIRAFTLGDDDY
jgi:hypothetical protein